jgi:methylphosphotriester-DNA--protein-cysteine methyltransferase
MEKVAMNNSSDTSGVYRPTANAPRFPSATASYAAGFRPRVACSPDSQSNTQAAEAANRIREV